MGIIYYLSAIAKYIKEIFYLHWSSRTPLESEGALPFKVINLKLSFFPLLIHKSFGGVSMIFRSINFTLLNNEVKCFFESDLKKILKNYASTGESVFIFERPMGITLLKTVSECPKILRAHNFEKHFHLEGGPLSKLINNTICGHLEEDFVSQCDLIFGITKEEINSMSEEYSIPLEKFVWIPCPIDINSIRLISEKEKEKAKEELGLGNKKTAIFIGSGSYQNQIYCVPIIQKLAKNYPNIQFLIVGNVSKFFTPSHNLLLFGYVSDEKKRMLLSSADVALNPVKTGSGMNIKMLEYLAHGVPVITTFKGMRGFSLRDGIDVFVASTERDFNDLISKFANDELPLEKVRKNARRLIEKEYSFEVVGKRAFLAIKKVYEKYY
ncbi:MAG: glycosyltransferase family 4 protein [Candidatus Thermoplasmatota archaeon]